MLTLKTRGFLITTVLMYCLSTELNAQDTLRYIGWIKRSFIYESIELYSNYTFKWTNEYDLLFSKYGSYKISNDTLRLNFYIDLNEPKTMGLVDSIKYVHYVKETRKYIMEKDRLYRINKQGRKVNCIKDPSLGSWIRCHKFHYIIVLQQHED